MAAIVTIFAPLTRFDAAGASLPRSNRECSPAGFFTNASVREFHSRLAASIRDDGPLPGVFTDMIEAQRDYARLIAGAEMILMLSSMLHSIGVGNMTPAGVKLVCVDINPAVVTKLADRGSIESIGVVTDVGLFLSLLVQQVRARNVHWQPRNQSEAEAPPPLNRRSSLSCSSSFFRFFSLTSTGSFEQISFEGFKARYNQVGANQLQGLCGKRR